MVKVNKYTVVLAITMLLSVLMLPIKTVAAIATTGKDAVKVGNEMFYFRLGGGPLMKYNVRTGKKNKVTNVIVGKDLVVKGKTLYYVENRNIEGEEYEYDCIYKIGTNGKGKKKLTEGSSPCIIGNTLYYIEKKVVNVYGDLCTMPTGYICKMNLDGTGKKRVGQCGKSAKGLFLYQNTIWYSKSYGPSGGHLFNLAGKKYQCGANLNYTVYCGLGSIQHIRSQNKEFFTNLVKNRYKEKLATKLYVKTIGKNDKKCIFNKNGYYINDYTVTNGYILVNAFPDSSGWEKAEQFILKIDGSNRVKVSEWLPVG